MAGLNNEPPGAAEDEITATGDATGTATGAWAIAMEAIAKNKAKIKSFINSPFKVFDLLQKYFLNLF